ncbi:MAG: hypothetical protein HKN84_13920 [Gammaproteobacteria bacterium]|nr:hypothetical protein [Gammaproteobacteria bacterium]
MDPNNAASGWLTDSTADEEFLLDEDLSELEVEDLLGYDVDFDEHDDWRAIDL